MEDSLTFWDLQKIKAWNFCKYKLVEQCWVPDLQHKHGLQPKQGCSSSSEFFCSKCRVHLLGGVRSLYPFVVRSLMDVLSCKKVQGEFKLLLLPPGVTAMQTVMKVIICSAMKVISPQGGTCPASAHAVFS